MGKPQNKIQKKRNAEDLVYQSMGRLRRFLSAKRPEHHLAVEYMVYVKRPLQEIHDLQADIRRIEELIGQVQNTTDELHVPLNLSIEMEKTEITNKT